MPRVKKNTAIETPVAPIEQAEESKTMEVLHDPDKNTVSFQVNGIEVELREPKGKDFLLMESWIKQAQGDYRDVQVALIKLASLCTIKFGKAKSVDFETLFDHLEEIEDVERVAAAISFFRDRIESYFKRYVQADS